MGEMDLKKAEYYTNRELSWLGFNNRILGEARDASLPLFERLKFLSITASNLDEFFMIRVASLKDMVHAGYTKKDISGMTASEQLKKILKETHELVDLQYSTYNRSLIPALKKRGLKIISEHESLSEEQKKFVDAYFEENVYPVLTPMAMDSSRPFPLIRNKTLNIGALICRKDGKEKHKTLDFATVQVPSVLPRIVELPEGKDGEKRVILLEEIIERNIGQLFLSYDVVCAHPYRVMRNADLSIDEDEAEDLLKEIQKQLKKRQWGEVIRLEIEGKIDKRLLDILKEEFAVKDSDVFEIGGPLDLTFLMKLYGMEGFEDCKVKKYIPQPVPALMNDDSIFANIRKGDILLHHPYMTFDPVVDFVKQAAKDPNVLAIKQTLYRVSGNSPIIAALAQAAENGKQVSVLVELKARFDEENNIIWARRLEEAGCHVIYGLMGLKTHAKIILVVRKEADGIKRYVHLGTGNYNDNTAKLYTDMGLMTANDQFGSDASAFFNVLSGYSDPPVWNKLVMAPLGLRKKIYELIDNEISIVKKGGTGHIIAKMNSLIDYPVIQKLYEASMAGVKIDLIIRGICGLRAGMDGISDNITVRSIVGRQLEHSRIFWFQGGGKEQLFLSSADWMPRNLNDRVELFFPVETPEHIERIKKVLDLYLRDNVGAHMMQSNGTYRRVTNRLEPVGAQSTLYEWALLAAAADKIPMQDRLRPMYDRDKA